MQDKPMVAFSAGMVEIEETIKAFLYRHMYRHERVMRIMRDAERIVANLFGHYLANPHELPAGWLPAGAEADQIARSIGDFIAGMTDRFALSEHVRTFDSTPDLR
jgi:dGTPase